jgi:DNA-binding FrmR family transcriptional regulator
MTSRSIPVPLPDCKNLTKRLLRIEGQLRGVVTMLEEGRDCADVVNQLAAARKAFDSAAMTAVLALAAHCSTPPEEGVPSITSDELRKLAATLS